MFLYDFLVCGCGCFFEYMHTVNQPAAAANRSTNPGGLEYTPHFCSVSWFSCKRCMFGVSPPHVFFWDHHSLEIRLASPQQQQPMLLVWNRDHCCVWGRLVGRHILRAFLLWRKAKRLPQWVWCLRTNLWSQMCNKKKWHGKVAVCNCYLKNMFFQHSMTVWQKTICDEIDLLHFLPVLYRNASLPLKNSQWESGGGS